MFIHRITILSTKRDIMKIISIEIDGLHGSSSKIELSFNDDLNIITGRNGAGKTTVLKLLWYIISGNVSLAINEIRFDKVHIVTSEYECTVDRFNENDCKIVLKDEDKNIILEDINSESENDINIFNEKITFIREHKKIKGKTILQEKGASLFFPTFRRIEGGFSTESKNSMNLFNHHIGVTDSLEEVLLSLSKQLSNKYHQFVASVSTKDIELLLIRKFSEFSEEVNHLQQQISNDAISKIKNSRLENIDAQNILDEVQIKIEDLEKIRNTKMQPFDALKDLVLNFLNHSGVKLGDKTNNSFNIGDTADTINSNLLSAGEKQMLSFIAYNIFYQDTIFIIDEPELSLHVDWQRQLLPTLMKQGTSNQFIIATHSPFIYSKYPDKETPLVEDRGYNTNELSDILNQE